MKRKRERKGFLQLLSHRGKNFQRGDDQWEIREFIEGVKP